MMDLFVLLRTLQVPFQKISEASDQRIRENVLDSRMVRQDSAFTAIKGFQMDGHRFIEGAYRAGCRNFIVENADSVPQEICQDSNVVQVGEIRRVFGLTARELNGRPDEHLIAFGITGTKGKTTVSTLLHHILDRHCSSALFTTVNYVAGDERGDSERTTMEADRLQSLLRKSLDFGQKNAVVEVSSHAVTLSRIEGIEWNVGIFTGFSRDHLDLYGTMENYFQAKADFFRALRASPKKNKVAVVNVDDPKGEEICRIFEQSNGSVKLLRVSKEKESADYFVKEWHYLEYSTELCICQKGRELGSYSVNLKGEFNVLNSALTIAAAMEMGVPDGMIREAIADFCGVPGRFEIVMKEPFQVIVDYAHTPESLEKILREARQMTAGRVLAVFGCTGDRDKEKRAVMGKIAFENADCSFLTNDDTYTEGPECIMEMLVDGFRENGAVEGEDYRVIFDRKRAIAAAMETAKAGDLIVLAGMGHEKVQILNQGRVPHNDKETVLALKKKMIDQRK